MTTATSSDPPTFDDSEEFNRALRAAGVEEPELEVDSDDEDEGAKLLRRPPIEQVQVVDQRFERPTPSPVKRAALLLFIAFLFWLAFNLRAKPRAEEVVYARRYSREYKYRPAASPIITQTLADGRVKLRGAYPTPTSTPTPTKKAYKKRRSGKKRSAKGKKAASKK